MTNFESVKQFMTACGQDVHTKITTPSVDIVKLRLKLIVEEVFELFAATLSNELKLDIERSAEQWMDWITDLPEDFISVDFIATADALSDIEYINSGSAAAFGIDLDKCFAEVHRSNMSKLGSDGKAIKRDDGKVLKSELYTPPNLVDILYPAYGDD